MSRGCAHGPRLRRIAAVLVLAASVCACRLRGADAPEPAIRVTNHASGTVIRYPVPLLRGTVPGTSGPSLTVTNTTSRRPTREGTGLVHQGRFKSLTELVPGENQLVLRAGKHECALSLTYHPQTNPYVVRVIYFTDSSGATEYQSPFENDPQDFRSKLDTAMKLLQTFTAESLNKIGLGRRTFALELDEAGRVRVHTLRGARDAAFYHTLNGNQLYQEVARELARQMPHPTSRNLVIPAFTRFDPKAKTTYAHTALGGGNLALFGGGDLFTWPSSLADVQTVFMDATPVDPDAVFSDSVGRHTVWAIASTTLGAALHELGHTFGLPHCMEQHDLMTRGGDRLNRFFTFVEPPHARRETPYEFSDDEVAEWAPVSGEALAPQRWFSLDEPSTATTAPPAVESELEQAAVAVRSEAGLGYIGVRRYDAGGSTQALYRIPLDRGQGSTPTAARIGFGELGKRVGTRHVSLWAMDSLGQSTRVLLPDLLAGPYVRAWRFAPETRPWSSSDSFADMDAGSLSRIQASARNAPLVRSGTDYVDFLARTGQLNRERQVRYALRTIKSETSRRVTMHTGSDDALRVWLNGELVTHVLALRSAQPDAERTDAELRPGDNELLVEVSQGFGNWGLFLRLEDEDGTRLALTDDGHLQRADPESLRRAQRLLAGPFVRKWRFAPEPHPWKTFSAFVFLAPRGIETIERAAMATELQGADDGTPLVDFTRHFPEGQRTSVAGYALRTIHVERPRHVKIHTGSDDALRLWLNGECITRVLRLRQARPDSECTVADLVPGENHVLVEVSQAAGAWGLCLRFEDMDGGSLYLSDDGELARLE